mmetsp:Transcript_45994/g.72056  ORF Transcript_45994/g.72056 Transcript_45994/m.72056 type:complete len:280 (-) Transcript_45994:163-1002(-)
MPNTPRQAKRNNHNQNQGMQGSQRNLKMPTIILAPPPAINWVPGGKSSRTKAADLSSSKEGPSGASDRTLPALIDALKSAGERRPELVEKLANARIRANGVKTPTEEVKFGSTSMPPLSKDSLRETMMGKAVVVGAGGLSISSMAGGGEVATGQLNGKGWAYTGKFKGSHIQRGARGRIGLSARDALLDGSPGEAPPRIASMANPANGEDQKGSNTAQKRSGSRQQADTAAPVESSGARPPSGKAGGLAASPAALQDRGMEGMDAIPIGIAASALGSGL